MHTYFTFGTYLSLALNSSGAGAQINTASQFRLHMCLRIKFICEFDAMLVCNVAVC